MSREKQIEEMAHLMCANYDGESGLCGDGTMCDHDCWAYREATHLHNAGYRKQSEGEWIFEFTLSDDDFYKCSVCGRQEVINGLCKERNPVEHYPYCHCGAKMKGVAE